jgi:hypothetical protein
MDSSGAIEPPIMVSKRLPSKAPDQGRRKGRPKQVPQKVAEPIDDRPTAMPLTLSNGT